ncbi:MAG: DUF5667 domain-containing protein [Candidatus Binatia bacterium]
MHDDGLDAEREALNAAADALLAGAAPDAVGARLPDDLRPLIGAAERLVRRRSTGDAPRPGFVIGLGDQLRTDLRLALMQPADVPPSDVATAADVAGGERPPIRRGWWAVALAGMLFGFAGGIVVRSGVARPGDPLYGVKRGVESVQLRAADDALGRVGARLDQAWRRLGELQSMVRGGRWTEDQLQRLVNDLLVSYDEALAMAADVDGDARALRRARADADAAAGELNRLSGTLNLSMRSVVAAAVERLRLRIASAPVPPDAPESPSPPNVAPGGEPIAFVPPPAAALPGQAPPSPAPAPTSPPEDPTSQPTSEPAPTPTPSPPAPIGTPPTATAPPAATPTRAGAPPPGEPAPPGVTPTGATEPMTPAAAPPTATPHAPTAAPSPTPIETTRATEPPPPLPPPASATPTRRIEPTLTARRAPPPRGAATRRRRRRRRRRRSRRRPIRRIRRTPPRRR